MPSPGTSQNHNRYPPQESSTSNGKKCVTKLDDRLAEIRKAIMIKLQDANSVLDNPISVSDFWKLCKDIQQGPSSSAKTATTTKLSDLVITDDVPSSAVELQVKEKYLRKLNRQERVIEEVKMVSKPYYQRKDITKEEYKEIMRKTVPKVKIAPVFFAMKCIMNEEDSVRS